MIFLKLLLKQWSDIHKRAVSLPKREVQDDPIFHTSHLQDYITSFHYDKCINI